MLINNQLLLAKVETSKGVDAAPIPSANSILSEPVEAKFDVQTISSNVVRKSISAAKTRIGRKLINFTITCELKGSGVLGTPPEFSPLLQACAFGETVNTGVSVVYKPVSAISAMKTCTIWFYYDGKVRKAVGCVGTFTLAAPAGQIATIAFNMRGRYSVEADLALPTDEVFQDVTPAIVESCGLSFGAYDDAVVRSISFLPNNNLTERNSVNSPEGLHSILSSARDPQFNASVEAETEAVKSWFANFTGRVEEALDMTIGATGGNTVSIVCPKIALNAPPEPQNENGIVLFPITGQCLEDSGDDNITITFA